MQNKLQIPHSLTTVCDAVATHLDHFRELTPHDFGYHRTREGGIEYFHLRLRPVMTVGSAERQVDLGYIRLRKLDKTLTEFTIQDSRQLSDGPDLFLDARMMFSDEDYEDERKMSLEKHRIRAAARFERFKARHQDAREAVMAGLREDHLLLAEPKLSDVATLTETYIDKSRIAQLRQLKSADFDLSRLIRLCEEMNKCFASNSFFATAALVRSAIDHIPPIFGARTFSEVANHMSGKSIKSTFMRLETSSRNIADSVLHQQIRKSEVLPTKTQVDFRNDLDVLVAEIIRILK